MMIRKVNLDEVREWNALWRDRPDRGGDTPQGHAYLVAMERELRERRAEDKR